MNSKFLKDFDTIFNEILVDYRGQEPDTDTAKGSLVFLKSACLASALWGAYRHQEWISDQIFPDDADPANMEHHAWIQGVLRRVGETDDQLLARDLDDRRRPPAGGNKYDYVKWAKEAKGGDGERLVKEAYCIPLGQGPGSVDLVIIANNETGVPDSALLDKVKTYIEDKRPAGMRYLRVLAPEDVPADVTVKYAGDVDTTVIEADIASYIAQHVPGQEFVLALLNKALVAGNNLTDLMITAPAANVAATAYQRITRGTISAAKL